MQHETTDPDEDDDLLDDYSEMLAQGGWERGKYWTGAKRKPLVYHVGNALLPDGRWIASVDEIPEIRAIADSREAALDSVQALTADLLRTRDPSIFRSFALCLAIHDPGPSREACELGPGLP